jgi:hypothetical protein
MYYRGLQMAVALLEIWEQMLFPKVPILWS